MLIRGFHDGSHSPYDEQIGITCSSVATCSPCASFEDLRHRQELSETKLRDHCGGRDASSCFISAADDPMWLRSQRTSIWPPMRSTRLRFAFIRTDVLSRLGILYDRSDRLVKDIGAVPWSKAHPDGIPYVHNAHWLIYGWIPSQAIHAIVELSDFLRACDAVEPATGTVYGKKLQTFEIFANGCTVSVFHHRPEDILAQMELDHVTNGVAEL